MSPAKMSEISTSGTGVPEKPALFVVPQEEKKVAKRKRVKIEGKILFESIQFIIYSSLDENQGKNSISIASPFAEVLAAFLAKEIYSS